MISDLWQGLILFTRLPLLQFVLLCRTLYINRLTCQKWSCICEAHEFHETFLLLFFFKSLNIYLRRVPIWISHVTWRWFVLFTAPIIYNQHVKWPFSWNFKASSAIIYWIRNHFWVLIKLHCMRWSITSEVIKSNKARRYLW